MKLLLGMILYLMSLNVMAQCTPERGPAPKDTLFNTGTNRKGGILKGGSKDLNWSIAEDSINGFYRPAVVMGSIPTSYATSPWPNCTWIAHSEDGYHTDSVELFYKLTFNLPCKDFCGRSFNERGAFCLNFDIMVDNSIHEVYVNNKPQSSRLVGVPSKNPYYNNGFGNGKKITISLCNDWKAGKNELVLYLKSAALFEGLLVQASTNTLLPKSIAADFDTVTASICQGQSILFGKNNVSLPGYYKEVYSNIYGCDSTVVLRLKSNPVKRDTLIVNLCDGEKFAGYDKSGIYSDTFRTYLGCDSIKTYIIRKGYSSLSHINASICEGGAFNGHTRSGIYNDTFITSMGCDSVIHLVLDVKAKSGLKIWAPDTVCMNSGPVILKSSVSGGRWSGEHIRDSVFDPSGLLLSGYYSRPYKFIYSLFDTSLKCNVSDSLLITVQDTVQVSFINKQLLNVCETMGIEIEINARYPDHIAWKTSGDGSFKELGYRKKVYRHGVDDSISGQATIFVHAGGVCAASSDSINIQIQKQPIVILPPHMEACGPAVINFSSMVPNIGHNLMYSWDFGNGQRLMNTSNGSPSGILYDDDTSTYDIHLDVVNQWGSRPDEYCSASVDSPLYVILHPTPQADFNTRPGLFTTVASTGFQFENKTECALTPVYYYWDFGEDSGNSDTSTVKDPYFRYHADTGKFRVVLKSAYRYDYLGQIHECADVSTLVITIGPDVTVFMPNALNPSSGILANSIFKPSVSGELTYLLEVYNRWGELLYRSTDKHQGWDGTFNGKDCEQDVYMWVLWVSGFDSKIYTYNGTVTLLR